MCPQLSFSYRIRTLQRLIRFENASILSLRMLKWTWRIRISIYQPPEIGAELKVWCLFLWRHRFQIASFSSSTLENSVFKKHHFQIAPLWGAFSMAPFSVIVFDVVVWTTAVSGAKQLRFRLKADYCGRGLSKPRRRRHCCQTNFNGQSNGNARAFWILVHFFFAVLCKTTTRND